MSLFAPDAAQPGHPYWWDDGAPLPELDAQPPDRTEILVVGGGYTGLSAAIACAGEGATVTVIDAAYPGSGVSTRNGGMFGAHPRLSYETMCSRFGPDVAAACFNESTAAFEFTRELIAREDIDCDFQQTGRIQMAWSPTDFDSQKQLVASAASHSDLKMELIDRAELSGEIATERYFGGIRFPGHAAVHPRKFHDGLLAAAIKHNVTVIRDCPLMQIRSDGGRFIATSQSGTITADKVIVATNGYTKGLSNWLQRRVFPLPSFLIATEPIAPDILSRLAPGRRMMVETRAKHSYFRIAPDGSRVIFGGRAAMRPITPQRAATRLFKTMTEFWPELSDVKLTHSWSGITGYSFSHMPCVGTHDGFHFAAGFSGSGVAMAPYLGMKVAYQVLGDPRGQTVYSEIPLAGRLFHPGGQPHFLRLADIWFRQFTDRRDNFRAR